MATDVTPPEFPIGIVGSGTMGRGIAQIAAVAGFPVRLFDANAAAVVDAQTFVGRMLSRAAEKGQMDAAAAKAAAANRTFARRPNEICTSSPLSR